jgi:large subunit ribosomal protein L17
MSSHRIDGRKLSRKHGPRMALYKNLMVSVLRYERVQTTEAKAKEIRGQVERLITLAKRGDLHARRQALSALGHDKGLVYKLFEEIAPRYGGRSGGYTRILKLGPRRSDATEMVFLELV